MVFNSSFRKANTYVNRTPPPPKQRRPRRTRRPCHSGPRRGVFINAADRDGERRRTARRRHDRLLRHARSDLPHALRVHVQLRAAFRTSGRLDFLRPFRRAAALRRDGLRSRRVRSEHDADIISYAAGHKALGLYAMWALRNEIARIAAPELLPVEAQFQFRLEDLLGFRRNPSASTPLFKKFHAKALDGHPTPATPFVRLATGASGVGLAGLARPGLGGGGCLRRERAARSHHRRRRRNDAGPRGRSARRRRHRIAR